MNSAHIQAFTSVPFLHPYGTAPGHYNPQYSEHFGSPSALLPATTTATPQHNPATPQHNPATPQSDHTKQNLCRTSPSDVDINLPSWTALSAEGASDDEDLGLLKSHTTIPKPMQKDSTQQDSITSASGSNRVHSSVKRRPSSLFKDVVVPTLYQTKKPRLEHPPATPQDMQQAALHTTTTHAKDVPNPTLNLPTGLHQLSAPDIRSLTGPHPSARQRHANSDARTVTAPSSGESGATSTSAPERPHRKAKPLPPITEDSEMTEWKRVDDQLETHVAPSLVLPRYAQARALQRQEGGAQRPVHVPLRRDDFQRRSKGKQRAQPVWTETRWSNVGEFKARLDTMFGPGEITRGMGRAPKNGNKRAAVEPGATASEAQRSDAEDAGTGEDERDTIGFPQVSRRGRLEKLGF